MVARSFWIDLIEAAWRKRSLIWLGGVRRAGKTTIAKDLHNVEYFDCELPRVRRLLEDSEAFFHERSGGRVILDEVHRLDNPSEVLKIGADHFPKIKILATGSSTLQASAKFRDTLTGRKEEIWLTPMISADLDDFNSTGIKHRLHRGGLPPFFLSRDFPEREFQEWMDSYWSKDVQELFRLEKRASFQKFIELLFTVSGGIFVATNFSGPCQISHTTVANYLSVMEQTGVAKVLRPFAQNASSEITSAPKVYAFDTGFVSYYRGWDTLRPDDCGVLWEHFILNEILAHAGTTSVRYWRDKQKHEIDFVLVPRGGNPIAVECKWKADAFDDSALRIFRSRYPEGENWVVAADVEKPYRRSKKGTEVTFLGARDLSRRLRR